MKSKEAKSGGRDRIPWTTSGATIELYGSTDRASYPVRQVWKKRSRSKWMQREQEIQACHPVYREMGTALDQSDGETGTPEIRAYKGFGQRIGLGMLYKNVLLRKRR